MHPQLVPPDSLAGLDEKEINVWKTEFDVVSTLRKAGHEVQPLGVQHELQPIREAVETWKPNVVFNLLEEFHSETAYDQNVASYLELLRIPYTGCNPRGLILARGKALAKKLVAFHRIRTPAFAVVPRGRVVRRPARLSFPLIVKSANEHASVGIAQASVVDSDEKLVERVAFVHERLGTEALVEQYVEGRELYVGVLGNDRLTVLPAWELRFGTMEESATPIATARVKHDLEYQEKWGISEGPAEGLPPAVEAAISQHLQAHLPHHRARWLRPPRFPAGHHGRALLPRSQPESGNRREGGIRPLREACGHFLPGSSAAHLSPGNPADRSRDGVGRRALS